MDTMTRNETAEKKIRNKWNEQAAKILKMELARDGVSHEQLAKKLTAIGVHETVNTVRLKLFRGTFQFAFFLQCAVALNIKNLKLDDLIEKMNA